MWIPWIDSPWNGNGRIRIAQEENKDGRGRADRIRERSWTCDERSIRSASKGAAPVHVGSISIHTGRTVPSWITSTNSIARAASSQRIVHAMLHRDFMNDGCVRMLRLRARSCGGEPSRHRRSGDQMTNRPDGSAGCPGRPPRMSGVGRHGLAQDARVARGSSLADAARRNGGSRSSRSGPGRATGRRRRRPPARRPGTGGWGASRGPTAQHPATVIADPGRRGSTGSTTKVGRREPT